MKRRGLEERERVRMEKEVERRGKERVTRD